MSEHRPAGQGAIMRRTLLLAAASTLAPLPASRALAAPPPFRTRGGQFIELDPREDVAGMVLEDFAGKRTPLRRYRGRPALLAFWASWCPPCLRELPILHRLQQREAELGFSVLPVSLDREVAKARRFIDRLGLRGFRSFIDTDGLVASGPKSLIQTPFQLYGMPMSYVLDAEMRTAGHLSGEADWSTPEALRLIRYFAAAA
jgi:thiol-disulfide isomerase/thioredoxin